MAVRAKQKEDEIRGNERVKIIKSRRHSPSYSNR
jgi:hypothetical protein